MAAVDGRKWHLDDPNALASVLGSVAIDALPRLLADPYNPSGCSPVLLGCMALFKVCVPIEQRNEHPAIHAFSGRTSIAKRARATARRLSCTCDWKRPVPLSGIITMAQDDYWAYGQTQPISETDISRLCWLSIWMMSVVLGHHASQASINVEKNTILYGVPRERKSGQTSTWPQTSTQILPYGPEILCTSILQWTQDPLRNTVDSTFLTKFLGTLLFVLESQVAPYICSSGPLATLLVSTVKNPHSAWTADRHSATAQGLQEMADRCFCTLAVISYLLRNARQVADPCEIRVLAMGGERPAALTEASNTVILSTRQHVRHRLCLQSRIPGPVP